MRARRLLRGAMLCAASCAVSCAAIGAAPGDAAAQPIDSLRARVEEAVVRGSGTELDLVIARLRREVRATPDNVVLQYDLGYALFRRGSALAREGRPEEARRRFEESDRALARAVALGAGGGGLALRGTVNSRLASVSGMVASMRLEPLAYRQLDEALALAPDDPRVALLNGIARLDAPRPYGGGLTEGEEELRRAIVLFGGDSARPPAPSWGRADAHIWLGIALARQGQRDEARASFLRALEFAPGHTWVTSTLLPQVAGRNDARPP